MNTFALPEKRGSIISGRAPAKPSDEGVIIYIYKPISSMVFFETFF